MKNEVLLSEAKHRLLEKIRRGEVALPTGEEAIEPCAQDTPVPLSPSQRQIWLHSQMAPGMPIYNEAITIRRRGPLDRAALERTFREIVRRHAIWRTTFATRQGHVVQVVHQDFIVPIAFSDVSSLPPNEREAAATRLAEGDAQRCFHVEAGPLLRPRLVKLGDEDYRFHLTLHHLVFDGMTAFRVLVRELSALYGAFSQGRPSPFPEPRLQYADYALWQQRQLEKDFVARQLDYWQQTLAGAETASSLLPTDRPRPAVPTFRGGTEVFAFPRGLIEGVQRVAREEGATKYMVLLACFHALLYKYSGSEDLMVGGVTDGRRRSEFESLMGSFTNTVVLRTRPRGDLTFREFLGQVKEVVLGATENGDVPFDSVVRHLQPKRDASYNPFYQVLFSIDPPPENERHPGWELEQLGIDPGAAKCDLFFALDEFENGMTGRLYYSSDLFDPETVRRLIGHWLTLLEAVVRQPGARLRDVTILTSAETRELLVERNATAREIPPLTVQGLIERQVQLTPDRVAIEAAGILLTYRELNARANRLARRLQDAGVTAETLVAVCVGRTLDLVVAPLAVLKAGGAYLPLDPGFPKERLVFMIEDSQTPVLLSSRQLKDHLPPTSAQVLYCDQWSGDALSDDGSDPTSAATPENLAYVRYTSGSTGRPKGVEISHRALVNLLLSMQCEPGFTQDDSLLAITTHSFDISDLELYLPLISGGRLVIATRDEALDPRRLIERLREAECTVMQATPATWRGLIDAGWNGQRNLRAFCGGEPLPRDLAALLLARTAELWNLYGPTETTVWSALHRVTSRSGPVPIGHPMDNTQIYILDPNQNLVPMGASGELYIGGAGVARGYLRRAEPMHRFVPNPFRPGERLYRTGDLARRLPDGTIECLGRVDNQAKIRGFRIEPGEIEAVLDRHEAVGSCVVVVREDTPGDKRLIAYFTSQAAAVPSASDLRAYLKRDLPEYMIPSAFVFMHKMPLSPIGKIDRKKLPAPEENRAEVRDDSAAPRDPIEQTLSRIWARVLKVKQVGLYDDFFALGGHSLDAVRLLMEIQKVTGKTLPLATLFQASTVEALASVLRKERWTPSWSSLVPIQPLGSKCPLFLVHGAEGNVLLYRQVTQHLGPNQPVYGLQSQGLSGDRHFHTTIREMASHYVQEVISVHPDGPYLLGGYCLGGTIAFEMAQQLSALGKRVELVFLLDTYNLSSVSPSKLTLQAPLRLLQNVWYHFANAVSLRAKARAKFLRAKRDIAIARTRIRFQAAYHALRRLCSKNEQDQCPHMFVKRVNDQANMEYVPKPYGGRVVVIKSKASFVGLTSPSLGWDACVNGGLEIYEVPMYPKAMLVEPFCQSLAQVLNQVLAAKATDAPYRALPARIIHEPTADFHFAGEGA